VERDEEVCRRERALAPDPGEHFLDHGRRQLDQLREGSSHLLSLDTKLKVKYSNTCTVEIEEQFVSLVLGLNQVYKLFSGIISFQDVHSFVSSKRCYFKNLKFWLR
jgi:hypothetical protein